MLLITCTCADVKATVKTGPAKTKPAGPDRLLRPWGFSIGKIVKVLHTCTYTCMYSSLLLCVCVGEVGFLSLNSLANELYMLCCVVVVALPF